MREHISAAEEDEEDKKKTKRPGREHLRHRDWDDRSKYLADGTLKRGHPRPGAGVSNGHAANAQGRGLRQAGEARCKAACSGMRFSITKDLSEFQHWLRNARPR
jgi:hypothetical protein